MVKEIMRLGQSLFFILPVYFLFFQPVTGWCGKSGAVRDAVWADKFYPGSSPLLSENIDAYTRKARETKIFIPPGKEVRAVVLPHAGYIYSGYTAAHSSRVLESGRYKKVILVGPDHRVGFSGAVTSDASGYATPLGIVPIHQDAEKLLAGSSYFKTNWSSDISEHSLEVVLPFLQKYLGVFELVPIVVGRGPLQPLIDDIVKISDRETLLVISSDLSHYLQYDKAVQKDKKTVQMILDMDADKLLTTENTACGVRPIAIGFALARHFGWQPGLLHYSNSGDTAGKKDNVVGYAAIAFWGDAIMKENMADRLDPGKGQILCRLARQTIVQRLGSSIPAAEIAKVSKELEDPSFKEKRGVFVTLKRNGQLRGCIGSLSGIEPIVEGVRRNALNAAFNDYRFSPLTIEELDMIDIEVSVLSEPSPLAYEGVEDLIEKLRPGIDGVILSKGGRSATFLPQVWEQLPKTEDFLSRLAVKAGLPANVWRQEKVGVKTYQVQYFDEER